MQQRRIAVFIVCVSMSLFGVASAQNVYISGGASGGGSGDDGDLTCKQETGTERYFPNLAPNSVVTVGNVQYYNLYGTPCRDVTSKEVSATGICVLKDGKPACQATKCGPDGKCETPDVKVNTDAKDLSKDTVQLTPEVPKQVGSQNSVLDAAFNPSSLSEQKMTLSGGTSGEKALEGIKEASASDEGGFIDAAKETWSNVKTFFGATPSREEAVQLSGGSLGEANTVQTTSDGNLHESGNTFGTPPVSDTFVAAKEECSVWCTVKGYASNAYEGAKDAVRYAYESVVPSATARDLHPVAGEAIIESTAMVCKVRECDAETFAKALGGSCVQESQCDPTRQHRGSQYQGLGQLNATGVRQSFEELARMRDSGLLNEQERARINEVLQKTEPWLNGAKGAQDPRFDPVAGAYLFAARHGQMTPPEWGREFSPINKIQEVAPGDAATQAKLIQLTQLAPSIHVTGNLDDLDKPLSTSQRSALANNALAGVTTVRQALTRMDSSEAYGRNLPKGVAWISETLNPDVPLPPTRPPETAMAYGSGSDIADSPAQQAISDALQGPKPFSLSGVHSKSPEFVLGGADAGLSGGASAGARSVITQPVVEQPLPDAEPYPVLAVSSSDLPPISATQRMRQYVTDLVQEHRAEHVGTLAVEGLGGSSYFGPQNLEDIERATRNASATEVVREYAAEVAAQDRIAAQASAQADLMERNVAVEAQFESIREVQRDELRVYQDRIAQAQRDSAEYRAAVRLVESDAFDAGVELSPSQVQAAYAAESERLKREALHSGRSISDTDYSSFYDSVGIPEESQLRGIDPAVVGAIERTRAEARVAEAEALQRYENERINAEIAELRGERPCQTIGFISCPLDDAARQLQNAQTRLLDVETRYEACLSGTCPEDVQRAIASSRADAGAATSWLSRAEQWLQGDAERRIQARIDGEFVGPFNVDAIIVPLEDSAAMVARGVRAVGNSIPGGEYLGFRESQQDAIARAFNPNNALEGDIKAVRDATVVLGPAGLDVSLGSRAFRSVGNWTAAPSAPTLEGFARTEIARGVDVYTPSNVSPIDDAVGLGSRESPIAMRQNPVTGVYEPVNTTFPTPLVREVNDVPTPQSAVPRSSLIDDIIEVNQPGVEVAEQVSRVAVNDVPVTRTASEVVPTGTTRPNVDAPVEVREVTPNTTVQAANDNVPQVRATDPYQVFDDAVQRVRNVADDLYPGANPSAWARVAVEENAARARTLFGSATADDWARVAANENAAALTGQSGVFSNATPVPWGNVSRLTDEILQTAPRATPFSDVSDVAWREVARLETNAAVSPLRALPAPDSINPTLVTRDPFITTGLADEVSVSRPISEVAAPPVTPEVRLNELTERTVAEPIVARPPVSALSERIQDTFNDARAIFVRDADEVPSVRPTETAPAVTQIDEIAETPSMAPTLRESRVATYQSEVSPARDAVPEITVPRDRVVTITARPAEAAPVNADLVTVRLVDDAANLRVQGASLVTDASGRMVEVRVPRTELAALERGEAGVTVYARADIPAVRPVDVRDVLVEIPETRPSITERAVAWLRSWRTDVEPVPEVRDVVPLGAEASPLLDDFTIPTMRDLEAPEVRPLTVQQAEPIRITAPATPIDEPLGADAPAIVGDIRIPGAAVPETPAVEVSTAAPQGVLSRAWSNTKKAFTGLGPIVALPFLGSTQQTGEQAPATTPGAPVPATPGTTARTNTPPAAGTAGSTQTSAGGGGAAPRTASSPQAPPGAVPEIGSTAPQGSSNNLLGFLGGVLGQAAGSFLKTFGFGGAEGQQPQSPQPQQPAASNPQTTPTPAAPAVTMVANPSRVAQGERATLSWSAAGPTACSVFDGQGEKIGEGNPSSDPFEPLRVAPEKTTIYKITCTGGSGTASGEVTVEVE